MSSYGMYDISNLPVPPYEERGPFEEITISYREAGRRVYYRSPFGKLYRATVLFRLSTGLYRLSVNGRPVYASEEQVS